MKEVPWGCDCIYCAECAPRYDALSNVDWVTEPYRVIFLDELLIVEELLRKKAVYSEDRVPLNKAYEMRYSGRVERTLSSVAYVPEKKWAVGKKKLVGYELTLRDKRGRRGTCECGSVVESWDEWGREYTIYVRNQR